MTICLILLLLGSGTTPLEGSECTLVCLDSTDVFTRPDSSARLMGKLAPRTRVMISGKTGDGWLGFDPGVAQAGNTGSFRLRWISTAARYVLDGELAEVPLVWGPVPGITYAMTGFSLPLYSQPDSSSQVVDSIPPFSAGEIVARTAEWYLVDLSQGPEERGVQGWIPSIDVSVSGSLDSIVVEE